jgi:hypothetical protein
VATSAEAYMRVKSRIVWVWAASSVVEHLTFNQVVAGSIPARPTNRINNLAAPGTSWGNMGVTRIRPCRLRRAGFRGTLASPGTRFRIPHSPPYLNCSRRRG